MNQLAQLIKAAALKDIEIYLRDSPNSLNEIIYWGHNNKNQSHPLHFLCDCVFNKELEESQALDIANLFIDLGTNINGLFIEGKDTPILAACSLYCDQLGLRYLAAGPNLHHPGTLFATCLHWAAWTGSNVMVEALIKAGMNIEDKRNEYRSTPLAWAIHAIQNSNERNQRNQMECIQLLLNAGAQRNNIEVDPQKWPKLHQLFNVHPPIP